MRTLFLLAALLATTALAVHTDNLSHALKHHSSMSDAAHHVDHGRTANWLLSGARRCDGEFARELDSQLTAGAVTLVVHSSGMCVLKPSPAVDHDQLATVLMSEQRAGQLDGFHRERIAKLASH